MGVCRWHQMKLETIAKTNYMSSLQVFCRTVLFHGSCIPVAIEKFTTDF